MGPGAWFAVGRGSGLDQRRLEPARWVPARSRAGVPISCEEMGRKKPGVPPGPPFFKARSLLAARFGVVGRSGAVVGLFRSPSTCPDLGTFFRKMLFEYIFPKNASQISLSIPKVIAPLPSQRQQPPKPASGNERP